MVIRSQKQTCQGRINTWNSCHARALSTGHFQFYCKIPYLIGLQKARQVNQGISISFPPCTIEAQSAVQVGSWNTMDYSLPWSNFLYQMVQHLCCRVSFQLSFLCEKQSLFSKCSCGIWAHAFRCFVHDKRCVWLTSICLYRFRKETFAWQAESVNYLAGSISFFPFGLLMWFGTIPYIRRNFFKVSSLRHQQLCLLGKAVPDDLKQSIWGVQYTIVALLKYFVFEHLSKRFPDPHKLSDQFTRTTALLHMRRHCTHLSKWNRIR